MTRRSAWLLAGLVWLGGCGWMVYPAPTTDEHAVPADAEELSLTASDGVPVRAVAFPGARADAPVIVYFHGNGNVIGDVFGLARYVTQRGPSMFLVEYRGYGRSTKGSPCEDGLYRDAEAALAALAARDVPDTRIVLWGYSLGTGVAAEMAARGHAARLVLQAPFTSIPEMGAARVPWAPVKLLIDDRFDTLAKAPSIRLPTLVVHGDEDDVVPFSMGEQVAKAIPHAEFLPVPGMSHAGGAKFHWVLDRIVAFALGEA